MRRVSILAALFLVSVVAHAATMYDVTGLSPFGFANQIVLVEGWQQAALYNNVTITAPLRDNSSGGPIVGVEGTVYLTNSIGPGTTAANLVAPPVSISGLTASFTTQVLFTGLTLGPGNYFLVFKSTNTNPLSMSMEGSSFPVVTAGVGIFPRGGGSVVTSDPFPPASNVTLQPPGNLFVTVTGDLVTDFSIPALSTWALLILGGVLLVVGLKAAGR